MGRVFFRNRINEVYNTEGDGAVKYNPVNKKYKDDFVRTIEWDPEHPYMEKDKSHRRVTQTPTITPESIEKRRERYYKKMSGNYQHGLEALNKLHYDIDNLVDDWLDTATDIFGYQKFVFDYKDYVKSELRRNFLDFKDWCIRNGINIGDELDKLRVDRKIKNARTK